MRYFLIILILSSSAIAADFQAQLKPFINKYCVECHGPKKEKGDLRLDTLKTELTDLKTAEHWQHVLDELNGATMPPEDERQPQSKELAAVLETLTYEIELAKKKLYGKDRNVVMRKLNKREYINTVFDLTGIKLKDYDVPNDGKSTKFDTNGKGLFMSAYQFNKYRALAGKALSAAIIKDGKDRKINKRMDFTDLKNKEITKTISKLKKGPKKKASTKKKSPKEVKKKEQETLKDLEFLSTLQKQDAAKRAALMSNFSKGTKKLQEIKFTPFEGNFTPGNYRFSIQGGHVNTKPGDRVRISLVAKKKAAMQVLATFDLIQDYRQPQQKDFVFFLEEETEYLIESRIISIGKHTPLAAIKSLHVTGPLKEASHKKIFPVAQGKDSDREYAAKVIRSFIFKAFRNQPPTDKFINTMMNYYDLNKSKGMSVYRAVQGPLAVILSSPKFLYKFEKDSDTINDRELATRLSYFLWNTHPDITLLRLARANTLHQPQVLKEQIQRMIADKRFTSMAHGFVPQWLDLHKLKEVDVNRKLYKSYNDSVQKDVELESIHFFHTLASRNLTLENFIDSNFVVVNNNMRSYYGLPGKAGSEFKPLKLPEDSTRGGLLGQAAVLIMTGNGDRTSPVMRGNFVLSKMLGMPSPEPPPNVSPLENEKTKGLSVKEALKVHQAKPQCSSCHKRIDPAGFGLESFNAAGLLMKQKSSKKSIKVDEAGQLPNGQKFSNVTEMKKLLMNQKDKFTESLIEALMGYAYGREIGFADAKAIDAVLAASKAQKYRLGDLITNIILAPEFRQK